MADTNANPTYPDSLLEEIHADAHTNTGIENKKLIMWLFLASDCMFFGTLISTHLIYRKLYPFGHPTEGAVNITGTFDIELTSFSTFILLMSSFLMALAVSAMHKGAIQSFRNYTFGVIIFGLIFLGGQVYEFQHFFHGQGWYQWRAESEAGQVLIGNEENKLLFHDVADPANAKEGFNHEQLGLELLSFEPVGNLTAGAPATFKYEVLLPDEVGNEPLTFYGEYIYQPKDPHSSEIVVLSDIPPPPVVAEEKEAKQAEAEGESVQPTEEENVKPMDLDEAEKMAAAEEKAPAEEPTNTEESAEPHREASHEADAHTADAGHSEEAHGAPAVIPSSPSKIKAAAKDAFKHRNYGFTLTEFKAVKTVPSLDLRTSVFGSTFYVMTGTHGTHVAIGILWLFSMLIFSYSGRLTPKNAMDVEIAGLYWHFVDIVWIVIFTAVYLVEYI